MSAQRSAKGYGAVTWNGETRLARRRNTPGGVYGRGRHAPRSGVLALGDVGPTGEVYLAL